MDKALVYSTSEVEKILHKRLLLLGAAPFAVAALYGGSVAFAQSGEPTPSATPQQTAPAAPTDPSAPGGPNGHHSSADCPHMGGSGGPGGSSDSSQGSGSTTQTRLAPRGADSSSVAY